MITFICNAAAEQHLIDNIKQFTPKSLTVSADLAGVDRIKLEIIVSNRELPKVIDYLKEHYVKQYSGEIIYLTNYYT